MKSKFKFSLEPILKIRKEETKKAMEQMAPFVLQFNQTIESKKSAQKNLSKIDQCKKFNEENKKIFQAFEISYRLELHNLINILGKDEIRQEKELESFKENLLMAKRKERSLEILRSNRLKKWNKKQLKNNERTMEELAQMSLST